jgi:hypothetical protein
MDYYDWYLNSLEFARTVSRAHIVASMTLQC